MSPYPLEHIAPEDWPAVERMRALLAKDMNPPVPQARVFNSVDISILASGTRQALTFDSERYNNGNLHSTSANTSRLTAPITGLYEIGCCVTFASNVTGHRQLEIRLNGTTFVALLNCQAITVAGQDTVLAVSTEFEMVAGSYAEATVVQTSGGALNARAQSSFSPEFWMHRVGGFVNQGV